MALNLLSSVVVPLVVAIIGAGGLGIWRAIRSTGRRSGESMTVKTTDDLLRISGEQVDRAYEMLKAQREDFERREVEQREAFELRMTAALEDERRDCDQKMGELERRLRIELSPG